MNTKKHIVKENPAHIKADYNIKQNPIVYGFIKGLANTVSRLIFKRKFIRNELRGKRGPIVVIANHEAALDFVNIIGATRRPLTFVISNAFYSTLPCPGIVSKLGLLPKQQFQTTLRDIHSMKAAVENGKILVIYPAGLMTGDGNSTPIPAATFNFLKWLKADIYMAKNIGTYFSMPKWRHGGIRKGRTYTDVYKLFDKDEIAVMGSEEIRERTLAALDFDSYVDQEKYRVKYKRGDDIEGIENVLYMCPHCKKEFTVKTRDKSTIYCEACGFEEVANEYGFFKKTSRCGRPVRHASEWGRIIKSEIRKRIEKGTSRDLSSSVKIHMIDKKTRKYVECGEGNVTLTNSRIMLDGVANGEAIELSVPTACFASLPYKPGAYIEIQHGDSIFRCYPEDGRIAAKYVDTVEVLYNISNGYESKDHECACQVKQIKIAN